jgi:hypothetical protein
MERKKRTKKLIKLRQELFWDVDPKTINPQKHAQYIIERILDFGQDKEVRWLWYFYPKQTISSTVKNSRVIFPQTKILWQEMIKSR